MALPAAGKWCHHPHLDEGWRANCWSVVALESHSLQVTLKRSICFKESNASSRILSELLLVSILPHVALILCTFLISPNQALSATTNLQRVSFKPLQFTCRVCVFWWILSSDKVQHPLAAWIIIQMDGVSPWMCHCLSLHRLIFLPCTFVSLWRVNFSPFALHGPLFYIFFYDETDSYHNTRQLLNIINSIQILVLIVSLCALEILLEQGLAS